MSSPNEINSYAKAAKSSTPVSKKRSTLNKILGSQSPTPLSTILGSESPVVDIRSLSSKNKRKRESSSAESVILSAAPAKRFNLRSASSSNSQVSAPKPVVKSPTCNIAPPASPTFLSKGCQTMKLVAEERLINFYIKQVADEKSKNNKLSDKYFAEVQKNEVLNDTILDIKCKSQNGIDNASSSLVDQKEVTSKKNKLRYKPCAMLAPAFNLQTQTFVQLNSEIKKSRILSGTLVTVMNICDSTTARLTQRNVKNAREFVKDAVSVPADDESKSDKRVKLGSVVSINGVNHMFSLSPVVSDSSPEIMNYSTSIKKVIKQTINHLPLRTPSKFISRKNKLAKHRVSLDTFLETQTPEQTIPETVFPDPLIEITLSQDSLPPTQRETKKSQNGTLLGQNLDKLKKFTESASNPIDFTLFNISQESQLKADPVKCLTKPENCNIDFKSIVVPQASSSIYKDDSFILNSNDDIREMSINGRSFVLRSEDENSLTDEKIQIWDRKIKEEVPSSDNE